MWLYYRIYCDIYSSRNPGSFQVRVISGSCSFSLFFLSFFECCITTGVLCGIVKKFPARPRWLRSTFVAGVILHTTSGNKIMWFCSSRSPKLQFSCHTKRLQEFIRFCPQSPTGTDGVLLYGDPRGTGWRVDVIYFIEVSPRHFILTSGEAAFRSLILYISAVNKAGR